MTEALRNKEEPIGTFQEVKQVPGDGNFGGERVIINRGILWNVQK